MILVWIVLIKEINIKRKPLQQILQQPKSKTLQQTKNLKKNKNTKINKKSYLKGGSVLENNQEDDTKFITKARKVVDNVWDSYSLNG